MTIITRQISLSANDKPIEMDYFVQGFIDHTVYGMVTSLEGVTDISVLELHINGDKAGISVNENFLPLNDFVIKIMCSTVRGMVSCLKGVENTEKIRIMIQR
jgi:hypothetical protein